MTLRLARLLAAIPLACASAAALAQLTVACSVQAEWCTAAANEWFGGTGDPHLQAGELGLRKKIAAPACWEDLVTPALAGEVQMANPNASGTAPIKAAARGETLASVSFIHDVVTEAQAGFPVKSAAPCERWDREVGAVAKC